MRKIKHISVIGSGIMGSRIACHFANIGVKVLLLDICPSELLETEKEKGLTLKDKVVKNRLVKTSFFNTLKTKPGSLYVEENKENIPFSIEDYLDDTDEGKRILVVMPASIGDVFLCTSILKNLSETYKGYNIYFATQPSYFQILDGNEYIHKTIPYDSKMDDLLWLEGKGEHKGFFEVAYLPHLGTQRMFDYQHNGKDKIALDLF